jgi:hypothetical protein
VQNQVLRGGLGPVNVTVTATDQPTGGASVGTIVGSPAVFNGGDTNKNLAFDPAAAGISQIRVVPPSGFNFQTPSNAAVITATVTAPAINFFNQTIGRDLQIQGSVSLAVAAPAGGVQLTLTSADPARLVLSTSSTAQGTGQLVLPINAGATSPSTPVFVQALDGTGTVQITSSAPGYASQITTMTLAPSGFVIHPSLLGNFSTTTFSGTTALPIYSAQLNPVAGAGNLNFSQTQALRGGLGPVSVTVMATDQAGGPGVGAIVGSPAVFNGGDTNKSLAFDPAVAGTTQIQVVPPSGFSTPTNARVITATVTAPGILFGGGVTTTAVGQNLQTQLSISLGATPPGPVTVTVTVASTGIATIVNGTTGTLEGSSTVTFTNVSTASVGSIFVQGRAASGTTTVTAQAPGYADAVLTVTTQPSGFIINSPGNFSTTTTSGNTTIQIFSVRLNATTLNSDGTQAVRGGLTVNVPVTATDQTGGPGVGTITTNPVVFSGNQIIQNTAFNPAAVGTSLISVGVPTGFFSPSTSRQITATVN